MKHLIVTSYPLVSFENAYKAASRFKESFADKRSELHRITCLDDPWG